MYGFNGRVAHSAQEIMHESTPHFVQEAALQCEAARFGLHSVSSQNALKLYVPRTRLPSPLLRVAMHTPTRARAHTHDAYAYASCVCARARVGVCMATRSSGLGNLVRGTYSLSAF